MKRPTPRNAAQALVDQLVIQGVRHIFCVPGESYLPVLDALIGRDIELTVCRQEGGAAMMAEAVGKTTGRPGVCFVTRGPGATNAAHGVHIARQSSSPMILFVGQVDRAVRGRDAWQELDYAAVFGSMAKWVAEIDDAAAAARDGLARLPCGDERPAGARWCSPCRTTCCWTRSRRRTRAAPRPPSRRRAPAEMARLEALLGAAASPFVLLGGSGWDEAARGQMTRFAERFELPVATGFRRLPLFDPLHPNYAGDLGLGPNPALLARIKAADLVLAIGARLSEVTSQGYTLFEIPEPWAKLVHVFPEPSESSAVSGARTWPSTPPRLASPRPSKRFRRPRARPGAARPRRRTPNISPGRSGRRRSQAR